MKVVSTSTLVSSETEKIITACNFQHDYAMKGQENINMKLKNIQI